MTTSLLTSTSPQSSPPPSSVTRSGQHSAAQAARALALTSNQVANMQLKLHEPEIAAEIYTQLLDKVRGYVERVVYQLV